LFRRKYLYFPHLPRLTFSSRLLKTGSHGASKHVQLIAFPTVASAIDFLCNECNCKNIIGLLGAFPGAYSDSGYNVIDDENNQLICLSEQSAQSRDSRLSFSVDCYPFKIGNTCFVSGKNPCALASVFSGSCTGFIHVPIDASLVTSQTEGTPCLLDTQSILSIVLHHYTNWAGYDEQAFQGHKYAVVQSQTTSSGDARLKQRELREQSRKMNECSIEDAINGAVCSLFERDDAVSDN
jgi:hypothetical protein